MKAGRIVLQQIENYASQAKDFGFETTLSGKAYARTFDRLKAQGYKIFLFFLWVPDVHLALARIKQRVSKGGHDVPEKDVKRRYQRTIDNFIHIYKDRVDSWMFFDNSTEKPHLIASFADGKLSVEDKLRYEPIFKVKP
jgi:predicted ABC-type ATPase